MRIINNSCPVCSSYMREVAIDKYGRAMRNCRSCKKIYTIRHVSYDLVTSIRESKDICLDEVYETRYDCQPCLV